MLEQCLKIPNIKVLRDSITHCMIQKEDLAAKEISAGLNIALTLVITLVNYLKADVKIQTVL